MSTLFLHIGTPKTGSTTIQRALESRSEALESEGIIWLPRFEGTRRIRESKGFDPEVVRDGQDYIRGKILAADAPDKRFVMSEENFSGGIRNGFGNSSINARMLKAITDGIDTYIIVYVRRQDSFIESCFSHQLLRGSTDSFPEYLKLISDVSYDWHTLVSNFAEHFGSDRIIVRPYDRQSLDVSGGLVKSFADAIGSENLASGRVSDLRANTGYSESAAELARVSNGFMPKALTRALRAMLRITSPRKPFQEYAYFSPEARAEIIARYEPSNARLAKEFLGRTDGILFPVESSAQRT